MVGLLYHLAAVGASLRLPPVMNATYSVECSALDACNLVSGRSLQAVAWGRFEDAIEQSGTASLWVTTSSHGPKSVAAFAAGYLEGALSAERIFQMYTNFVQAYGVARPSRNLTSWLDDHAHWVEQQVEAAAPGEAYWASVAWQLGQLKGLVAGYNSVSSNPLTQRQMEILNLQGDIGDLLKVTDPSKRPQPTRMSSEELKAYTLESTHCSALVKLLPDNSELYIGHNMWWGYYTMLAVVKRYHFPGRAVASDSVMMTSYPGLLSSSDDFYLLGSGMVAMETTNPNYNASSYDLVHPHSLLYWQRAMAANYLAADAPSWMQLFSRHNSGTYNNMWMVLNYNLFRAGAPLVADTLWVGEQAPGFWHAEDQTHVLAYGYWPSYNRALYPGTRARVGQDEMVQTRGGYYSYALAPRAEIFRRDQSLVTGEAGMRRILRYNQYQTDPFAVNRSACDQLACRGDLQKHPVPLGAVNAKFTSAARFAKQQMLFVAGPTHDDQPVFTWSTAPASVQKEPHLGQPDRWDFEWALFGTDV